MDSKEYSGEWQPSEELSAFAKAQGIPIDRWAPREPSQSSEHQRELQFQHAKRLSTERIAIEALIQQYIADHTTGWPMPYFEPPDDALVPYAAYRAMNRHHYDMIMRLQERIVRLERPWWRRWLHR